MEENHKIRIANVKLTRFYVTKHPFCLTESFSVTHIFFQCAL